MTPKGQAVRSAESALAAPDLAHIGYHRTGTNFLQSEVFPLLEDELFVPDGSGWELFQLEPGAPLDRAAADAVYRPRRAQAGDGRLLVMTHESLSGTILRDAPETADRLAALNPAMRVLVVLRSQATIFPSLYHLHVKGGGSLAYPDYLRRALEGGKCDYLATVERLHAVFGAERVWVGLFEDLQASPQGLVDELCGFLGLSPPRLAPAPAVVNRRPGAARMRARRAGNALLAGDGERPTGWRHGLRELAGALAEKGEALAGRLGRERAAGPGDAHTAALIRERHAEGNRKLAALIGRPLDELGYPV